MIPTISKPSRNQPPSISSYSRNWTTTFLQNTVRWQQFAKEIDFSTLQLESHLVDSIRTFQLGEQSEGRTLKTLAAVYAQQHNDPEYLQAIQQFIKEEQRHACYLAKALQANGIELIAQQWSDGLFRKLRRLCGWEMMISVLLTAEVIAIAYYSALAQASREPQAKRLFERILQDESAHLQFHGKRLQQVRSGKLPVRWTLHRLLLWLVSVLVWVEHRHVLVYRFSSFFCFIKRCDALLREIAVKPNAFKGGT